MSTALTIPEIIEDTVELLPGFTRDDIVDLRASIDPEEKLTWSQIKVFLQMCTKMNLDPRRKLIHAIPRWNKNTGRLDLTTVTSIDGLRLVAERTGRYSPGQPTNFMHNAEGQLLGATVFVKKMTGDGTWHEVSETAFLHEYKPKRQNTFWDNMPSVMISKVAEARALRRAFPDTFSGIYGEDEMAQAAHETIPANQKSQVVTPIDQKITDEEWKAIDEYINGHQDVRDKLTKFCKLDNLRNMNKNQLEACRLYARGRIDGKNDASDEDKKEIKADKCDLD